MKIIKYILLSFLAAGLIACTGVFLLFQTFDTDQYLSLFTQRASLALGRPVSIGHLVLGLSSRGITLDAGPLIVADDPDFTSEPFIEVERMRVSLDLRSLVFGRKVKITNILLQSPEIHFIRSQEGNINIRSVLQKLQIAFRYHGPVANNSDNSGVVKVQSVDNGDAQKASAVLNIKSVTIQDASISYIDQSHAMPLDIWLNGINAGVHGFSLTKPFRFVLDASLLSNDPNVHASVLVSWDPSNRSVGISELSLLTDFSRLDMEQLKGISPQVSDSPVLKNISGVVRLNIAGLNIGPSGDIQADGGITITGGVIKDFNIIETLLSHALGVFGFGEGNINNLWGGQLKDTLGAKDTVIEKAQAQFSYHDKAVFITDSLVKTNIFELSAKGSIDPGLNVDMQTMLHLNTDASAALVNELGGLKYLCDGSDRIAIGASLQGVIPHLRYKPNKDFRKKSRRALMQEGGNILGILLGGR